VDVADSGSSSSCSLYPRMEPKTELARFRLPRETVDLGVPGVGVSARVVPSVDCFSPCCEMSEMVDMKEAARRFRSRFDGCDSSLVLVVFRPARAVRPLLPKMLLRLSLDMPRDGIGDAPPGTSSAAQESTLQVRSTCAAARGGQVERAVEGPAPPMALQIASYCVVSADERLISTASSRWLRHVLATRRRKCEARRKKQARELSSAPTADGGSRTAALRVAVTATVNCSR
jgi:hypothetical protein